MMRTMAPNDFAGRLLRNCARTIPELPKDTALSVILHARRVRFLIIAVPPPSLLPTPVMCHGSCSKGPQHTVCLGHLAPDDPDFCPPDLRLCPVNICDALSEVKGGSLGV
jgi:hypothetical protein